MDHVVVFDNNNMGGNVAAIKTLSAMSRHRLEQKGFIDFITALNPLDLDAENVIVVKVDGTTGALTISQISGINALVRAIANSSNDDIRVARSSGGVLSATATP